MNQPARCHPLLLKITVVIWALLYLLLCARTLILKVDAHSVYADFSNAGHHWLNSGELYVRGGINEFRYSPLIAAFFVPFDLLPPRLGEFLWRSLNFAAFVGGLFYCCRVGIPRCLSGCQQCAVFLLCIPLAAGSLNNAQSNPLVLGLMLIAVASLVQKRWTLSAVAITLATCFKLYPIALGMLLMLRFPWKIGWRLTVALLVAAVLPLLMQHADYVLHQYNVWVHYLVTEDRQRGPITDWYSDVRALWRVYVMPMRPQTYLIVEVASAAVLAGLCLWKSYRQMPINIWCGYTLSLACCWMTVLGPATESATYILLAPALAWGLVVAEAEPKSHKRRIAYGCVMAIFLVCQIAINISEKQWPPGGKWFRTHLQPLPLAGTLLMLTVMIETAQWKPQEAVDSEIE